METDLTKIWTSTTNLTRFRTSSSECGGLVSKSHVLTNNNLIEAKGINAAKAALIGRRLMDASEIG
jgi:hypothetical protein